MKNLVTIFFLVFLSFPVLSQVNPNYKYQRSYTRSNGTYVQGHYKTENNYTNRDNYTTRPNTNPYTGKKGYVRPDNRGSYGYGSGRARKR